MGNKDLHEKPFGESTIAKLEIFEDYAEAWIPTFVVQNGVSSICIIDFFAGAGFDKNEVPGSSIRILDKIKDQIALIFQNRVKVIVHLNEFEPKKKEQKKFALLKQACSEYLDNNPDVKRAIDLHLHNKDFDEIFYSLLPIINKYPSLVYLDQNGIKFLADKYLLELEKVSRTDFLYFISSSYFWRFGERDEFSEYIDINMAEAKKNPYKFIHRSIIEQLRNKLPPNTNLALYPYSIKKGANIHGIIFGASHPRAVDKFLAIVWKQNEVNGEANFDIDDDSKKKQDDLFDGRKLTKVQRFEEDVKHKILSNEITDNFELFDYTLKEGHIGRHAAKCLKEMKAKGEISYEGRSPLVTYENVYKKRKRVIYRVLNNE